LLHDTLHAPDAPNCLVSISRLDSGGGKVEINNGKMFAKNEGQSVNWDRGSEEQAILTGCTNGTPEHQPSKYRCSYETVLGPMAPLLWAFINQCIRHIKMQEYGKWTHH
jgi:hypothetical protein